MSVIRVAEITVNGTRYPWMDKRDPVEVNLGDDYLSITHKGNPRHYGKNRWTPARPFEFESIRVHTPAGLFPLGYPYNGATLVHQGTHEWQWELVAGQPYLPDFRHYPYQMESAHALTGGERIAWIFRPEDSHFLPVPSDRHTLLKKIGFNFGLYDRWPRGADMFRLFSGTGRSLEGRGEDLLSRMIREGRSWYEWGDLRWAEGHSNHHYGSAIHAMVSGLLNNDPVALSTGWQGALKQATTGLCWSGPDACWFVGLQHYEKAHERFGSYTFPAIYKQWALTTELANAIAPHPILQEAAKLRRSYWLSRPATLSGAREIWNGYYGERVGGFALRMLRDHYTFDPDNRAHYITWALTFLNLSLEYVFQEGDWWLHNNDRTEGKHLAPWQAATTLAAIYWWIDTLDLQGGREPLRRAIERWLDVGTGPHGQYWRVFYDVTPEGIVKNPGAPVHAAFGVPVVHAAKALGIEEAHGTPINEIIRRMERYGIGIGGQGRGSEEYPPVAIAKLLEEPSATWSFSTGFRGTLGATGSKVFSQILDASFYFSSENP